MIYRGTSSTRGALKLHMDSPGTEPRPSRSSAQVVAQPKGLVDEESVKRLRYFVRNPATWKNEDMGGQN
jgi:hypothetical protein